MEKILQSHLGGHLQALLNGCPEAILAINVDGIIKFANKEACRLSERDMNELIGESITVVYENMGAAREANRKIYEGAGTVHNYESKLKTKSGKLIPIRMSASHLKDSTGNYIGAVGYFAQYRPWAGAEAQVKARVEELESRLAKWKTLSAPVFELYPGLSVMVIVGQVDFDRFENITKNLLSHVEHVKTRVVLLDLSAGVIDDNEVANCLTKTIRTVHLLGASCVIAGMQTALARAVESLMADLGFVKSFSCMEVALEEALKIIGYEIRRKD